MCLDDTFVQRVTMHNYEMRHGDLINSHNIRVYKVSKMLTRERAAGACLSPRCAFRKFSDFSGADTFVTRQFDVSNATLLKYVHKNDIFAIINIPIDYLSGLSAVWFSSVSTTPRGRFYFILWKILANSCKSIRETYYCQSGRFIDAPCLSLLYVWR